MFIFIQLFNEEKWDVLNSLQKYNKNLEWIHRIKGFIRNTSRVSQFQKLCEKFDILFEPASKFQIQNGYMAGFFDADGTLESR